MFFQDISAIWPTDANLTGGEKPERIEVLVTSTNYFTMLAARPQVGRVYTANDERPGFIEGAVLSDGYWRRTFGGDRTRLGRESAWTAISIRLSGLCLRISGIRAAHLKATSRCGRRQGLTRRRFRISAEISKNGSGSDRAVTLGPFDRPGSSTLNIFSAQLSRQYPTDYPAPAGWGLRLVSLQEDQSAACGRSCSGCLEP